MHFAQLLVLLSVCAAAAAHGMWSKPRQRGAFRLRNRPAESLDEDAPTDYANHFPAGDKTNSAGSGLRSQKAAAGPEGWTPFLPLDKAFRWRSGVCGDTLTGGEHLKGGMYYYDGKRAEVYNQGDRVEFEAISVAHHNGFFEWYLCNIDKCSTDDISVDCFHNGHCQQLMRAPSKCDEGTSRDCGPIDPDYPGRWYLPCGDTSPGAQDLYGGEGKGTMVYQLPDDLYCDHCVIMWYWASANNCNPPGNREYFEREDGVSPRNWGTCPGQGGAIGGYSKVQRPCGGPKFSEEYLQCADVTILSNGAQTRSAPVAEPLVDPAPTPTVSPDPSTSVSVSPVVTPSASASSMSEILLLPSPTPSASESTLPTLTPSPSPRGSASTGMVPSATAMPDAIFTTPEALSIPEAGPARPRTQTPDSMTGPELFTQGTDIPMSSFEDEPFESPLFESPDFSPSPEIDAEESMPAYEVSPTAEATDSPIEWDSSEDFPVASTAPEPGHNYVRTAAVRASERTLSNSPFSWYRLLTRCRDC